MRSLLAIGLAFAALAVPRPSLALPKILICYGDPSPNVGPTMAAGINPAAANFAVVDAVDCARSTPSLQTLKMYDAVLAWDNSPFFDRPALGDVLYDYVNAGGGVVQGMFAFYNVGGQGWELQGKWAANKYSCLNTGNQGGAQLAAQPKDANSPLVKGVATLSANNVGTGGLAQGATSVWDFANGQPGIVTCMPGGHTRVDLNFYPFPTAWKGDGFAIIKNALIAVAGGLNPLQAKPSPVTFSDTGTGAISTPVTITFTNSSMLALTANSMAMTGMNPAEFTIVKQPQFPVTLQPAQTFTVDVAFVPATMGARAATLSIDVAQQQGMMAPPPPAQVQLSGKGIGAKLTVAPNPVNCGGTQVGVKVKTTVTVTNGGGGKIQIASMSVKGPMFVLTSLPDLPLVIGSGGSFPVVVEFTPVQNGITSDTITITTNDPNAPTITVPVSGFAGPPAIATDAGTVAFGSVNVGAKSIVNTLNVTNAGFSDLKITGALTLAGPNVGDFILDANMLGAGSVIPAQTSVPISLTFAPQAMGTRMATLSIPSNDAMTPTKVVNLLGTGTSAMLQVGPMVPLDFGLVRVATTSKAQDITIAAQGSGALKVMAVNFTGANPGVFTQVGGQAAPFTVMPNGMTSLQVACRPDAIGGVTGTATVVTDVGMASVMLKCAGTSPRITVTPNFIDFGPVPIMLQSTKQHVEIINNGTDSLEIKDLSIGGIDSGDFISGNIPQMLPVILAPMMKVAFDVVFTPSANGMESAQIDFYTDDPLLPMGHITMVGTGAQAGLVASPQPLDFGMVLFGATAGPLPVTISNNGDLPLLVTSVTIGAAGQQSFRVMPLIDMNNPVTLAPRQAISVNVTYTPNNLGALSSPLIIQAMGLPATTVTLKGSAWLPMLQFGISGGGGTLDFGDVTVGESSDPVEVQIRNAGTNRVTIDHLASDSPLFTVDASKAVLTLEPKAMTSVFVTFKPVKIELASARLGAFLADATIASASLKLQGNAVGAGPGGNTGGEDSSCSISRHSSPTSSGGALIWALFTLLFVTRVARRNQPSKEVR